MLTFRTEIFKGAFSKIVSVSSPIIWGFVIAYLLNPVMKFFEKWIGKLVNRKKTHFHLVRGLSVGISILLLLTALCGLIASIIPEITSNIQSISETIQDPDFISQMELKVRFIFDSFSEKAGFLEEYFPLEFDNTESFLLSVLNQLEIDSDKIFSRNGIIAGFTNGLMVILNSIKNGFLGIIVSVYLLYGKERFLAQAKKLVCALCTPKATARIFRTADNINRKFINYFTGVAVDCAWMGIASFLYMTLTHTPYALLISLLLALTNAIPIFGPYIGSIPSFLLVLLFSPNKAIFFLIFVIVLQQVDGNIIAPKILGDQLGLSAFWIMFAVFIGGGLFGFVGMIVAAPMFAVIYSICSEFVCVRLEEKGMPVETDSYMPEPEPASPTIVTAPIKKEDASASSEPETKPDHTAQ
jgi:predicted PurR-regulated permease PerM